MSLKHRFFPANYYALATLLTTQIFGIYFCKAQQTLYGTLGSSTSNAGAVYEVQMDGTGYHVIHEWPKVATGTERLTLIDDEKKKYLAPSFSGGDMDQGAIYSYDYSTDHFEQLASFTSDNGARPSSPLVPGEGPIFYGTTRMGGLYNGGVLYKFSLVDNSITNLFDFSQSDGVTPMEIIIGTDQLIYGLTNFGGLNNKGVIFSYDENTNAYTVLHTFDNDASSPGDDFIYDGENKVYGTVRGGIDLSYGAIFSFDISTNEFEIEYQFTENMGPSTLVTYENGKIYGSTEDGGTFGDGTLFDFDISNNEFHTLYEFDADNPEIGKEPGKFIIVDEKIYGQAYVGTGSYGIIYEFDLITEEFSRLFDFSVDKEFYGPFNLYALSDENLLGAGFFDLLFTFDLTTDEFSPEFNFTSYEGASPNGGLLFGTDSLLWGVTSRGGVDGGGTIFQVNPLDSSFVKRYDFDRSVAYRPFTGFNQKSDGKLIGTTSKGGANNFGSIYEFDPATNTFDVRFDFTSEHSFVNDYLPTLLGDTLVVGISYNPSTEIYSMFAVDLNERTIRTLVVFEGENGINPSGPTVYSATYEKLFGVTSIGGVNDGGVLYSYDLAEDNFEVLHNFPASGPGWPFGTLAEKDSILYGVMSRIIVNKPLDGLFRFNPRTQTYSDSFISGLDGSSGHFKLIGSSLIVAAPGKKVLIDYSGYVRTIKNFGAASPSSGYVGAFNFFPSTAPIPEMEFNEDEVFTLSLDGYFLDKEDSASEFTYVIDSVDNAGLVKNIDVTEGVLKIEPQNNLFGNGRVYLTGTDRGGLAVNNFLSFTIHPLPDPPIVKLDSGRYGDARSSRITIDKNPVDGPEVSQIKIDSVYNLSIFGSSGQVSQSEILALSNGGVNLDYEIVKAGKIEIRVSAILTTATDQLASPTKVATSFVEKAPLAASVKDTIKVYGSPNPDVSILYSGFVYGENINELDQVPVLSIYADNLSRAGRYPMEISRVTDDNYQLSYTNGYLTIEKFPAEIMLTNLVQLADGNAKTVSVSTTPSNLQFQITYDGKKTPPVEEGNYLVEVTINEINYSGYKSDTLKLIGPTTGIEPEKASISIFPVPVTDDLNIHLGRSFSDTEVVTLMLTDASGKILINQKTRGESAILSMQHVPAGLYFLSVSGDNTGSSTIRRVIKH
jgi:uncharacterized repeat protein (TIGR03803 family)